uniref:Histone chaperone n=1 Tax=Picocystis salinarum TaxID=88271 RepID=A0A7S3XEB4_9CHLO|mmetsp:Transcript_1582/g.9776  ORF Transcript_1582/g.9776 Transcript_1582/m.9776 type:complete len:183 (+) Transcript_1582:110-658(+)
MSAINVTQVSVLGNPAPYTHPFQFEISYECLYALQDDLEWKIVYVGSAEDEQYDQTLDSVLVGPVGVGSYRFVFQANPPDWTKIPPMDITGVTVILLTCAYRGKEFIRVGYYVNNEYVDEQLQQEPPQVPEIEKIQRSILADKPRVTKFPISFDDVEEERNNTTMYAAAPPPENNDAEAMQV